MSLGKKSRDNRKTEDPMKSRLFQNLAKAIEEGRRTLGYIDLFFDYDGVLTTITPRPQDALLNAETFDLIERISCHHSLGMTIVSGRSLADIRMRVGVRGVTYAGNHGLEIEGPDIQRIQEIPNSMSETICGLVEKLEKAMQIYSGVIVENKTLVIAVHFRLADPDDIPRILNDISMIMTNQKADQLCVITSGKKVVEIRPKVNWNKGKAVQFLLEERHGKNWTKQVLPVYIGDDETDEDAFVVLRERGITVRIGNQSPASTAAHYTLESSDEVLFFLKWLLLTLDT